MSQSGPSPLLGAVLSFFVVGLGQVYNGQWQKGLGMFVGTIVVCGFIWGGFWLVFSVWSIWDAYNEANKVSV